MNVPNGLDAVVLTGGRLREMILSLPSVVDGLHSTSEQVRKVVEGLPYLQEDELVAMGEKDNSCPICIVPFLALIAEEEMARAMDSPAHPVEELGVTRLVGDGRCGHVFCRKDLSKWIISGKNTCPLCRQPLFEPESRPPPAAVPAPNTASSTNTDTPNLARNSTTAPSPGGDQQEFEARLGEQIARLQESFATTLARGTAEASAPASAPVPTPDPNTDSAPRPTATSGTSADASQAADSGGNPSTRARGDGRIGRDLGEGHASDGDDDEDDEVLARLTAGMSPQEAQGLREAMAQMQTMLSGSMLQGSMFGFGSNGRRPREERDDDRDQFSGMYS